MKVGDHKLERVYFFMEEGNEYSFTGKNAHEIRKKLHDLKVLNRKNNGVYYGDIVVENNVLTYKEFQLIETPIDVDEYYIDSKNMTELKKKMSPILKGKKNAKLCAIDNGLVKVVTKKQPPKRLLLVEEIDSDDKQVVVEEANLKELKADNNTLYEHNQLPDARFIYYRKEYGLDYDSYKTNYAYKAYRVIARTTTLEEMDNILADVQNEYTASTKYNLDPNSKLSIVKLPDLKKYPVMYQEDKIYLDPKHLLNAYAKRCHDSVLISTLLSDNYTNLQPSVFDEDTMDNIDEEENTTRRTKVMRLKKSVKGLLTAYENEAKKNDKSNEGQKSLMELKEYLASEVRSLIIMLVYKDFKKKTINYSLLRHVGDMLKQRDIELENMREEYYAAMLSDIQKQIDEGALQETQFHIIRL